MNTRNRQLGCLHVPVIAGNRSHARPWLARVIGAGKVRCALLLLACTVTTSSPVAIAAGADAVPIDLAPNLMHVQLGGQKQTPAPKGESAARYLSTVPDLTGRTLAQASELLRRAHLGYQLTGETAGQQYEDRIASQDPLPREPAPTDRTVLLTRQPAPAQPVPMMVTVPPIVKMAVPAARSRLEEAGLELAPFDPVSRDEDAEIVEHQFPEPKKQVAPGSRVRVVVRAQAPAPVQPLVPAPVQPSVAAPGPPVETSAPVAAVEPPVPASPVTAHRKRNVVIVPDVVNHSEAEATQILRGAHLQARVASDRTAQQFVHKVLSQSPAAGTEVMPETSVQLTLQVPGTPLPLWLKLIAAAAGCIAIGGLVALLRNPPNNSSKVEWPHPFIVHATLTCRNGTHVLRGDPPRIACPPVNVQLTWPQRTAIRGTSSFDSTRQRTQ